jgi:hypothetical protein
MVMHLRDSTLNFYKFESERYFYSINFFNKRTSVISKDSLTPAPSYCR